MEIELKRKKILSDSTPIVYQDLKNKKTISTTIAKAAKGSLSSSKFSTFLRLLIDYLGISTVLETGTSFGINTAYLAKSKANHIVTIEGNESISDVAQKTFKELYLDSKITQLTGNLYANFETAISRYQPELIFLDADHRKSSIDFSLDVIKKNFSKVKCIIIHDIYWSRDMNAGWKAIVRDPEFPLTVDIFQAGLIFTDLSIEKQHFLLKF